MMPSTVQPKAVAHPTDSPLLNRAREQLVDAAKEAGIPLRQSCEAWDKHRTSGAGTPRQALISARSLQASPSVKPR